MAGLTLSEVPKLKLKWAFGLPGVRSALAQPTIVGGHIFLGSAAGKVYAIDASSGCVYWTFEAGSPVRSAVAVGVDAGGWTVYFGDLRANAYGIDALTGKLLWKTHLDDHPAAMITGGPLLVGAVLLVPVSSLEEVVGAGPGYPCCSFRGSLSALDAATGKVLWKSYTIAEPATPVRQNSHGTQLMGPSGAGIWSSPTFDLTKRLVYVTSGDNYSDPPTGTSDAFLAFDVDTGALAWSRQMTQGDAFNLACFSPEPINCPAEKGPDLDFGSSAILVELANGKRALIGGQKSGVVTAIDPDRNGEVIWQRRIGKGGTLGGIEWGSAADQNNLYVALSDVVLHVVPDGTPGSQKARSGPSILVDDKSGGGLFALNLETGDVVWAMPHPGCNQAPGCSPAQSAAVTAIPDVVFSGGLDGQLRAYAAADGRIIWDVDTKGDYRTVNGVVAHGGSINGPGAVVVGGMVYASSGYGIFGGMPGNVFLAYSVQGH